jgi:hypothetical protein
MAGENSTRVVEVVPCCFLMAGENSMRVLAGELGGEIGRGVGGRTPFSKMKNYFFPKTFFALPLFFLVLILIIVLKLLMN